jgi:hypothetical protein
VADVVDARPGHADGMTIITDIHMKIVRAATATEAIHDGALRWPQSPMVSAGVFAARVEQ